MNIYEKFKDVEYRNLQFYHCELNEIQRLQKVIIFYLRMIIACLPVYQIFFN